MIKSLKDLLDKFSRFTNSLVYDGGICKRLLNIDYIKIDGSLIKKIDEDIYFNLIKSIVLFSKQQDIKIVAEFVSDLKILRYVKNIEIDYSQGYHIGKPMSIEELIGEISCELNLKP